MCSNLIYSNLISSIMLNSTRGRKESMMLNCIYAEAQSVVPIKPTSTVPSGISAIDHLFDRPHIYLLILDERVAGTRLLD